MTDLELLELAAKEAGYQLKRMCDPVESGEEGSDFFHLDNRYWNPLTDDGDALRLAVRMGMLFSYMGDRFDLFQRCYMECLDANLPPSDATRRAIVRAAAEIGRAMR